MSYLDTTVQEGGGFLDDSRTNIDGEEKNKKRLDNVVPVMIQYLLTATGDLKCWDIQIQTVSVVGVVRHIDQASTKITYTVEDDTGTIKAIKWLEAEKTEVGPGIELNMYVKIHGMLRHQNGESHVLIMRIAPLQELNELTSHLLEVCFIHMKGKSLLSGSGGTNADGSMVQPMNTESSAAGQHYGMSQDQFSVLRVVRDNSEDEYGIERAALKAKVPAQVRSHVDQILEFLVSEGHIYTTRTDDHFKAI